MTQPVPVMTEIAILYDEVDKTTVMAGSSYLLDEIIDANPIPCFVIDINHVVTHWNKGCEAVLGRSAAEMVGGSNQWAVFYPEKRKTLADYIVDGYIDDNWLGPYRNKHIRPSPVISNAYEAEDFFPKIGSTGRWLHFTAAPLHDANGQLIGAIETLRDISEEKRAEIALLQLNETLETLVLQRTEELAEKNRLLTEALLHQEKLDRAKTVFLSAVSQELQSPLDCILGLAELIRMQSAKPEVNYEAQEIQSHAQKLHSVLSDLISMSEIAAGEAELRLMPFDPLETTGIVMARYRQRAEEKGLDFSLTKTSDCPEFVTGDATRYLRNVDALIDNAIKFTEQGSVVVELGKSDHCLSIRVMDTGPGIEPEAQARIFEHFDQGGQHSPARLSGMGLGLALAKAQAMMMGGNLTVESLRGLGSVFTLTMPIKLEKKGES